MAKVPVKVKVTYFKQRGKYYTDDVFSCEAELIPENQPIEQRWIYLNDVLDAYNRRITEGNDAPGLCSDGRNFHKVFTTAEGQPDLVPHLLPADVQD